MLNELKFVQGAVAKKDFLPALTHFRIEDGKIRSFNGTLALCTPLDIDIDCTPKAVPFVKAIQNSKATVSMHLTKTGKLSIKSGAFKAFVECVDIETPHVLPEGDLYDIDGDTLLKGLKQVEPFIGDDASRPWSNGVLLKGPSLFATNNVCVIEYWTGLEFPVTCNIPRSAVREMLRIGKPPIQAQATETSICFHYEGGQWIRTSLLATKWPNLEKILSVPCDPKPIPDELYEALDVVKPFVDKLQRVYIKDSIISSSLVNDEGASYEMPDFPFEGAYSLSMLTKLKGIATSLDFAMYPDPCIFYGDKIRGAIIGMRT